MKQLVVFMGALLSAPLFSQPHAGLAEKAFELEIKWILGVESKIQVLERLGPPRQTGQFGDFISMQYQIGVADHDDFSHILVVRKSNGALVSLARSYDPEVIVDNLFAVDGVSVHYFPDEKKPQFSLRLRRLNGGRVLMAMGSAKPGTPTGQLVIMVESELRNFYPWLKDQLDKAGVR